MTTVWRFDRTFHIDLAPVGQSQRVAFVGELDALTARCLRASDPIAFEAGTAYVLDLAALDLLDASGVREIRRIEAAIIEAGATVEVRGTTPATQPMFGLIRMSGRS